MTRTVTTPGNTQAKAGLVEVSTDAVRAGGSLRIESNPGRGTRIVLTLPMRPPATPA